MTASSKFGASVQWPTTAETSRLRHFVALCLVASVLAAVGSLLWSRNVATSTRFHNHLLLGLEETFAKVEVQLIQCRDHRGGGADRCLFVLSQLQLLAESLSSLNRSVAADSAPFGGDVIRSITGLDRRIRAALPFVLQTCSPAADATASEASPPTMDHLATYAAGCLPEIHKWAHLSAIEPFSTTEILDTRDEQELAARRFFQWVFLVQRYITPLGTQSAAVLEDAVERATSLLNDGQAQPLSRYGFGARYFVARATMEVVRTGVSSMQDRIWPGVSHYIRRMHAADEPASLLTVYRYRDLLDRLFALGLPKIHATVFLDEMKTDAAYEWHSFVPFMAAHQQQRSGPFAEGGFAESWESSDVSTTNRGNQEWASAHQVFLNRTGSVPAPASCGSTAMALDLLDMLLDSSPSSVHPTMRQEAPRRIDILAARRYLRRCWQLSDHGGFLHDIQNVLLAKSVIMEALATESIGTAQPQLSRHAPAPTPQRAPGDTELFTDLEATYYACVMLGRRKTPIVDPEPAVQWMRTDDERVNFLWGVATLALALALDGLVLLQTYSTETAVVHYRQIGFCSLSLGLLVAAPFFDVYLAVLPYFLFLSAGAVEMAFLVLRSLRHRLASRSVFRLLFQSNSSPMMILVCAVLPWAAFLLVVLTLAPNGLYGRYVEWIFLWYHLAVPLVAAYALQLSKFGALKYRQAMYPAAYGIWLVDFALLIAAIVAPAGARGIRLLFASARIAAKEFTLLFVFPMCALLCTHLAVFLGTLLFERLHRISASEFLGIAKKRD